MRQRLWMSGLIVSVSLVLWTLPGCKKADDTGTGTTSGPVSGPAPTGPVSMAATGDTATSGWPSDLPKFQGGQLARAHTGGAAGAFRGATFTQIKNPESTFQQYKAALEAMGWVFDEDTSNDVTWASAFTKGAKDLHVSVSKDGLMANLMYSAD